MTTRVETYPLISIRSSATLQEAARLMADCSIAALGVLGSDRKFVGILTERDMSWIVAQGEDAKTSTVDEFVNDFPVTVEGPIEEKEALEQMRKAHVRHLIVREGDDLRIVSMRDLVLRMHGEESVREPVARDVMTAPVIACRDKAFLEEVAELLADRDISGVPVVNAESRVVGVISERDLAHALGGPMVRLAVRRHGHGTSVAAVGRVPRDARRAQDVMTTPPVSVVQDAPLDVVARLMRTHQINRVPVIEKDRLVGIVSRGDVLGAVAKISHASNDLSRPPIVAGSAGLNPGIASTMS